MSPSAYEYLQHILDKTAYIVDSADGLNKAIFRIVLTYWTGRDRIAKTSHYRCITT
jgi:hypothetical protein